MYELDLTRAQENVSVQKNDIPAAYLEDLGAQPQKPWPEALNLQGVHEFDPNDPLYYAMEHCGAEPRVKQLRWVNDSSVNLEFYNEDDATVALGKLTHPDVMNADELGPQDSRPAKSYSKMPDIVLRIRQTNAGDQKPKGAAKNSSYYQRNPDVAGNRQREPRKRQPPKRDFLDYGDDDTGSRERRRRNSGDESMDDGDFDRRRNRRNDRDNRDTRGRGGRGGRFRDDRDSGRLREDVDSYRPGTRRYSHRSPSSRVQLNRVSPREPRTGRLRGRSASPASGEEGDGRFGFAEDSSNLRTRYRSRSRSRPRRRREPSGERWTHDRYGTTNDRWQHDAYAVDTSPMGNHRRSDAMDGGRKGGSLLARMTKDGQPLLAQKRSLADRITRDTDDDDSYGRLKGDESEPFINDFSDREPKPRRNLIDRISRDTEINIRGRGQEGINIRGASSNSAGGINIKGVASGA